VTGGASPREWTLLSPEPDLVREISARHDLTTAAATVLANRGIVERSGIGRFLNGTLSDLSDPSLLKDSDKAARRLAAAGSRREPVLIYADYDADGATGAACISFPQKFGPSVRIHQATPEGGYVLQGRSRRGGAGGFPPRGNRGYRDHGHGALREAAREESR
jgi:hypothetical protein